MKNFKNIFGKLTSIFLIFSLSVFSLNFSVDDYFLPTMNYEYYNAVSDIMNENNSEDYFSSINLKIGSDVMYIDGTEHTVTPGINNNGEILLPYSAIAAALNEPNADSLEKLLDVDSIASALGLTVCIEDEQITLTKDYQLKQIIVKMNGWKKLRDTYGAVSVADNGKGEYFLQYLTIQDTKTAHELFLKDKRIEYALLNTVVFSAEAAKMHNVPSNENKNSIDALPSRWGAERIGADYFINHLSSNKNSIKVAVLDTGIDTKHTHLSSRIIAGFDLVKNTAYIIDTNGHGTHVAGIINDCTPSNVKIMPVTILDSDGYGNEYRSNLGIKFAVDSGALVLNLSYGGSCSLSSCLEKKAVDYAVDKGATVVVSAGNDNKSINNVCPAKLSNTITVSASDKSDNIAYFSNYGNAVDIAAPGVDIYSSVPDNNYEFFSGTSMAAPFVAAGAAMIKLDKSSLNPRGIKTELCASTDYAGEGTRNDHFGCGILNLIKYLKIEIKVTEVLLHSTSINTTIYNEEEQSFYFSATVLPKNATDKKLTYSSSNKDVAEYKDNEIVVKKPGNAVITVRAASGVTATCTVVAEEGIYPDWERNAAKEYAGGAGTQSDPYLIQTPKQLAKIIVDINSYTNLSNKYFKLISDIDLSGKIWDNGNNHFTGNFDGNNHIIKNLTESEPYNGKPLFGSIYNANIENLGIIQNESISNAFDFSEYDLSYGVLAGFATNSTITNCFTTSGLAQNGFVGFLSFCTVSNCWSDVTSVKSGFVYESDNSSIANCYSAGEVLPNISRYTITTGFIFQEENTVIYNSFSVSNTALGYGFAAYTYSNSVNNCYYLNENPIGVLKNTFNILPEAKAHDFFTKKESYTNADNWNGEHPWDFTNTWTVSSNINSGLPVLKGFKLDYKSKQPSKGVWTDHAADSYASGNGTQEDPFLIQTPEQLARIAKVYKRGGGEFVWFSLANDIDLIEYDWVPIGYEHSTPYSADIEYMFCGNILGNNKKILNINTRFIYNFCGIIENTFFEDVFISGTGAIAEKIVSGQVINCRVAGEFGNNSSGIAKYISAGTEIIGCKVDIFPFKSQGYNGITSENNASIIRNCSVYIKSDTAMNYSGITFSNKGIISNCSVIDLSDCSNTSKNMEDGYIEYSYHLSNGSKYLFFDNRPSFYSSKTAQQMKNISTYTGWDFDTVWDIDESINGGYPFLRKVEYIIPKQPRGFWTQYAADSYAGGNGTKNDPYLIETPQQLAKIADDYDNINQNSYFKINKELDLSEHIWITAGIYLPMHYGSAIIRSSMGMYWDKYINIDGNEKIISNMHLSNGCGFIAFLQDASHLWLENVSGASTSGLSYRISSEGTVEGSHVTGKLKNIAYSMNNLTGLTSYNYGQIKNSYFDGELYGQCVVGMAGDAGQIDSCYTAGRILASEKIHLIGMPYYSYDSYLISNSYSSMECFGTDNVFFYSNFMESCFYDDTRATGNNNGFLNRSDRHVIGRTTEQMKKSSTYSNVYAFDFNNSDIWGIDEKINGGYPYLKGNCAHNGIKVDFYYFNNLLDTKVFSYIDDSSLEDLNLEALLDPPYMGYEFIGWFSKPNGTGEQYSWYYEIKDDISLYAYFIIPVINESDYTLNGIASTISTPTEWNKKDVIFTPINGYVQISSDGFIWHDHLTLSQDVKDKAVTIYLKNAGGGVTEGLTFYYNLDKTPPSIAGLVNDRVYYFLDRKFEVTDTFLESVTINGEQTDVFILSGDIDSTYEIIAVDEAGNTTKITVTIDSRKITGDADNNGIIAIQDAIYIFKLLADKLPLPDGKEFISADIDGDGKVSIKDAILIFRHLADKINLNEI